MSKTVKNAALCFGSLLVGFVLVLIFFPKPVPKSKQELISPTTEKVASFSAEIPPSNSLKGTVTTLTGDVLWQSRVATEAAKISNLSQVQQGEQIKTGNDGVVKLEFKDQAKIVVSAKSQLNIVQTIPANFVFAQTDGTVEYQRTGNIPLSIRAMHLLIDEDLGDVIISVNKDDGTVIVNVRTGNVTIGFNDTDLKSNLITIPQGKEYIFDDTTRTGVIKTSH
jgi:hypothetical protein